MCSSPMFGNLINSIKCTECGVAVMKFFEVSVHTMFGETFFNVGQMLIYSDFKLSCCSAYVLSMDTPRRRLHGLNYM